MADCPKCGHRNADDAQFCVNSSCRTYLGFATGAFTAPTGPEPPGPVTATARVPVPPPAAGDAPAGTRPATVPQESPESQRRGVRVRLEPASVTVEPGGAAMSTVTVRNVGTRVEEFRLSVAGPAARFTTPEPAALSVYPDSEGTATLRFSPGRGPEPPAGELPYDVYAASVLHADVVDRAHGAVTVGPYHEVTTALQPEASRGRRAGLHTVVLGNAGNIPTGAQVTFSDRDSVLGFEPAQTGATLYPGQEVSLPVRVTGPRRWFGRTEAHAFSTVVTPTGRPPVTLNGVRHQVPVFPWWIPTAVLAVAALVIAIIALLPGDKVPSTTGLTEVEATRTLEDAGYQVVSIPQPHPSIRAGLAIRTDPPVGAQLDDGEIVQLLVSTGPCTGVCPVEIPDVEGLPLSDAQAALTAAGFKISRVIRVPDQTFGKGVTVRTKPPAGTERPPGSEVVLTVSTGKPQPSPTMGELVVVPDVGGHPKAEAIEALEGAGLQVHVVEQESTTPTGRAIETDPPAGAEVKRDTTVELFVSTGPAVHVEGDLTVPQTWAVDLDEGVLDEDVRDVWFRAQTATNRSITPRNEATIASLGEVEPSYDGCANAELSEDPIPVQELSTGTVLCVLTDEGRMSVVRVEQPPGPSPGELKITFTTYESG